MRKRMLWMLLMVVFLLVACDAVRENPAATADSAPTGSGQPFVTIASYGYYTDSEFLPDEIRQSLDAFGSLMWLEPSLQTKIYTQIPEPENNAKGVDPVFIVMPELDSGKYKGPYIWDDFETGWQITAAYRQVGDMLTDELVKVYVDDAGNICQYETVNLGQYDELELSQRYLESARLHFDDAMQMHLGSVTREFYNSKQQHAPSAYRLFTDTEGNLVLSTTAVLTGAAGTVELYAILKTGTVYE